MRRLDRFLVAGEACAPALVLRAPVSFWGGVDVETGEIIDRSHPDLGRSVRDRILIMACGRGSSSSSSVLAETIRRRVGPLGILLTRPDPILAVGAIVAETLYGLACPIAVGSIDGLATDDIVRIFAAEGGAAALEIRSRVAPPSA
ncbi:MAG TPA: DUF126 domain-containing protein [Roseiarcus sp.]|nr:DUF126 domain-containing protein [Roseiarcus sp.]